MLIDSTTARSDHLSVGDVAPVKFAATGPTTIRIGGIYEANALIGSYLVSNSYFRAHFTNEQPRSRAPAHQRCQRRRQRRQRPPLPATRT